MNRHQQRQMTVWKKKITKKPRISIQIHKQQLWNNQKKKMLNGVNSARAKYLAETEIKSERNKVQNPFIAYKLV